MPRAFPISQALDEIARAAMHGGFGPHLLRGLYAGFLIALMVWLLPFAESARVAVIIIITCVIGIGRFSHSIAGAAETLYLVAGAKCTLGAWVWQFFLPTLLGNMLGGIPLVAVINHAQVVSGES